MQNFKNRYYVIIFLLVVLLVYLLWGPLFPWSPIKIGYTKNVFSKGVVYISDITEKDSAVYNIDKIILEEEKFHNLQYVDDFRIIVLDRENNMKRYLPWLSGGGYSVSLSVVNVIYIGPTARQSPSGIEPYLRHELSHLLIDQNATFSSALEIHDQGWLAEGIAEYVGNRSFYSKSDFLEIYKIQNIDFSTLLEKNPLKMTNEELKFNYSFYRFFIEFLIDSYGIEMLQKYLKIYITNPKAYKKLFVEIYSSDINTILKNFNSSLE